MTKKAVKRDPCEKHIACDLAMKIAQSDAEKVYRDLSEYRITIAIEPDGWHIDYNLKDPRIKGGGPHYVIEKESGQVVSNTNLRFKK